LTRLIAFTDVVIDSGKFGNKKMNEEILAKIKT
jgi:hypothetical protein